MRPIGNLDTIRKILRNFKISLGGLGLKEDVQPVVIIEDPEEICTLKDITTLLFSISPAGTGWAFSTGSFTVPEGEIWVLTNMCARVSTGTMTMIYVGAANNNVLTAASCLSTVYPTGKQVVGIVGTWFAAFEPTEKIYAMIYVDAYTSGAVSAIATVKKYRTK